MLCSEESLLWWRIYTNTAWQWCVSLKILAATSLPQLSSWLSGIPFPKESVLGVKRCVQDSQICLGEMTEGKKKLSQEHTEEGTAGELITMGNHWRRRVEEEGWWGRWGRIGIVWAVPIHKWEGLSGEKSMSWDLAAEVCLEKVESEMKMWTWEGTSEICSLILLMKVKDEVLVDEVVRQFCFPSGGGINCVLVVEDLGAIAF